MTKYIYLVIPTEGLASILNILYRLLIFCENNNRILLFNSFNGPYKINFSDYFNINSKNIIYNLDEIKLILKKNSNCTIYPPNFEIENTEYNWSKEHQCIVGKYKNNTYIFNNNINYYKDFAEDIIMCALSGGGGDANKFIINFLSLNENMKQNCLINYNKIPKPYLVIQIRNTDRECDYEKLYEEQKNLIDSFSNIYIATDDKYSIEYFKTKNLNIYNFTTFHNYNKVKCNRKYPSIHKANIEGDIKIKDTISDLYLMTMADKLISNSVGGYIALAYKLRESNYNILSADNVKNIF